jgi:hypothetical protein
MSCLYESTCPGDNAESYHIQMVLNNALPFLSSACQCCNQQNSSSILIQFQNCDKPDVTESLAFDSD